MMGQFTAPSPSSSVEFGSTMSACPGTPESLWSPQTSSREKLEGKREGGGGDGHGLFFFPTETPGNLQASPCGICKVSAPRRAGWKEWGWSGGWRVGRCRFQNYSFPPTFQIGPPSLSQKFPRESSWEPNFESPVSVLSKSFLVSSDLAPL